jgi:hypothetical protein
LTCVSIKKMGVALYARNKAQEKFYGSLWIHIFCASGKEIKGQNITCCWSSCPIVPRRESPYTPTHAKEANQRHGPGPYGSPVSHHSCRQTLDVAGYACDLAWRWWTPHIRLSLQFLFQGEQSIRAQSAQTGDHPKSWQTLYTYDVQGGCADRSSNDPQELENQKLTEDHTSKQQIVNSNPSLPTLIFWLLSFP